MFYGKLANVGEKGLENCKRNMKYCLLTPFPNDNAMDNFHC